MPKKWAKRRAVSPVIARWPFRIPVMRAYVDETLLNEIVRRVPPVARPDKIILFVSAAAGEMTNDSDVDLLIVEPELASTHERSVRSVAPLATSAIRWT